MKSKTIYHIYIYIIILSLVSCNGTSKNNILPIFKNIDSETYESNVKDMALSGNIPTLVSISNVTNDQPIFQSSLFDTVIPVKLSNQPEALIGVIDKIVFSDSIIYILDRYKTKSIKKFSINGDFLSAIGTWGEGPDEYIEPTDFNVYGNEILVYDQFKSDIKYYDLEGHLKYRKKLPFLFLRFACFSTNRYVFQAVNADNDHLQSIVNYSIFESDSAFVLNQRGFYRPKNMYQNYIDQNFYFTPNKLFYHPTYNDTIYSINSDNSINIEYIFDFKGKKLLPLEYQLQENSRELMKIMDTDKYIFFSGAFVPTNDYLYFKYSIKHLVYAGIYSSKTNKAIVGSSFITDINPFSTVTNNILTSIDNNILIGYAQTEGIADYVKNNPRKELVKLYGENIIEFMETVKDEDNPIILFFKIKNF